MARRHDASFLRPLHGPGRCGVARGSATGNDPVRAGRGAAHRKVHAAGTAQVERVTLLHRERTHATPIIPGSPGHRPPRAGVSGPEWSRVGSAGRPTRSRREGQTVPPMTQTLPGTHPPSPCPPCVSPPCPCPCSSPSHRGPSSTAGRAHLGSRRSQTVGPACQSAAGRHRQPPSRTRAGGRGRDQHRDQILLVGPTEPAQLAAGMEARGGRARSRAARARPGCAPRGRPGAHGLPAGHGERAARGPRPASLPPRTRCASNATRRRCSSPSGGSATAARCRTRSRRRTARWSRHAPGSPARRPTSAPPAAPRSRRPRAASPSCPCCAATWVARRRWTPHRSSGATPASSPARTCSPARCSSSWAPPRSPGSRTR